MPRLRSTGAHHRPSSLSPTNCQLRMNDMIESNRKKVDAATNGRVGYVYIPDMEDDGLNEFVKQYYPQIHKEGMISMFDTTAGGLWISSSSSGCGGAFRHELGPQLGDRQRRTIPPLVFNGSMAAITNQYAASTGHLQRVFQGLQAWAAYRRAHLGGSARHPGHDCR